VAEVGWGGGGEEEGDEERECAKEASMWSLLKKKWISTSPRP